MSSSVPTQLPEHQTQNGAASETKRIVEQQKAGHQASFNWRAGVDIVMATTGRGLGEILLATARAPGKLQIPNRTPKSRAISTRPLKGLPQPRCHYHVRALGACGDLVEFRYIVSQVVSDPR